MNITDNEKLSYLAKIIEADESIDLYQREEAIGYIQELQKKSNMSSTLPFDHFYYSVDLWHDGAKHTLDIRGFRSPATAGIDYVCYLGNIEIGVGSGWRAGQYGFAGEADVEYKVLIAESLDKAKDFLKGEENGE
tara:strand:+ start:215 stop:619 length:405 start_codon:yes stop_codon:yes gene_type:complete